MILPLDSFPDSRAHANGQGAGGSAGPVLALPAPSAGGNPKKRPHPRLDEADSERGSDGDDEEGGAAAGGAPTAGPASKRA